MGQVPTIDDLLTRIKALEDQVSALQKRGFGQDASTRGSFRVYTSDGLDLKAFFGPLDYGGTQSIGWIFYRDNGLPVFQLEGSNPANQFVSVRDEFLDIVFSDDAATGFGLATPWISYQANSWDDILTPPKNTSSGTFTTLWRAHGFQQHPKIRVMLVVQTPVGTTGEVRLFDGAAQIAINSIPSGDNAYHFLDGAPSSPVYAQNLFIDVQARITGGAGPIRVLPVLVQGRQS